MLNKLLTFALIACTLCSCERAKPAPDNSPQTIVANSVETLDNAAIEQAFANRESDVQVSGHGVVAKLLADDNKGARHQKFLVKINAVQTLLFAHNIDLASRIPLQINDTITFNGEYVYNPKGGIVHWTHLDPGGHHPAGWVKLNGQIYQ